MKDFIRYYAACLLVFAGMLCGCQRVDPAPATNTIETTVVSAGEKQPSLDYADPQSFGLAYTVDPQTGCEYLLYSRGITPRMESAPGGNSYSYTKQKGCK